MMMSKPKPEAAAAAAAAAKSSVSVSNKAPVPVDAVADLERRLADLSSATPHIAPSVELMLPPAFAVAPSPVPPLPTTTTTAAATTAAATPTATTTTATSNKNALLARIMAAQERAKQAQGAPVMSAPPAVDFLSMDTTIAAPTPSFGSSVEQPPPSFDFMEAQPPPPPAMFEAPPAFDESLMTMMTPPAFDSSFLPPPLQEQEQQAAAPASFMQWDPHAAASAPAFEDLVDHHHPHPPAMLPPPVQPPSATDADGLDDKTLQAILGIEGLTAAEKQELISEQLKIMKSIEDSKKSAQVSAADAFEQRSFSAAVQAVGGGRTGNNSINSTSSNMQLHGQERTREAIADGTAIMVQCTSCENWMQVTGTAQLMFCPVCQTVSPVQGSGLTAEEAQQMAADAKLAEQLQKEEYEEADRSAAAASSPRVRASAAAAPAASSSSSSSSKSTSWMEWLGFGTPAPAPATRARGEEAAPEAASGEIHFAHSRDSADGEGDGLLGSGGGRHRQGGRVATQQPLFACVTDSISTAANYALSGTALHEDAEGNVHGVDSSSLLAVTQVGRGGGASSNQRYEQMPEQE